jgi:putative ABC transport system substrate-binding protein
MKRRAFIALLGGAAAWPLAARAQQAAALVVGFVSSRSLDGSARHAAAFGQGLSQTGYVDGQNVTVEYHWLDGKYDRLPSLMGDLVRRSVAVIAAIGDPPTRAAKAATATIPIAFGVSGDPVAHGLVASLARPGGNATGINFLTSEVLAKRLGLLRELVPAATRVALLLDPSVRQMTETKLADVEAAARPKGLQIQVLNVQTTSEINAAFATFIHERPDALFVGPGPFFTNRRIQLALLAAFHRVPAIYPLRQCAEAGGLMSYGASLTEAYRQVGAYAGRILKGANPADLPVVQPSKFELVINAQTALMLGLTVPASLLSVADEVIE